MQTPLEELIEYIEEFTVKNKITTGIWSKAKSLIDKEKQVIERAYQDGFTDNFSNEELYYEQTFNNQ